MKEATGELSMTAVVVVIIGILAVALPVIINSVINSMERSANCRAAYGCQTSVCNGTTTTMQCLYMPEDATTSEIAAGGRTIVCPCDTEYTQ